MTINVNVFCLIIEFGMRSMSQIGYRNTTMQSSEMLVDQSTSMCELLNLKDRLRLTILLKWTTKYFLIQSLGNKTIAHENAE